MEKGFDDNINRSLAVRREILRAALRDMDLPVVVGVAVKGLEELIGATSAAAFIVDDETGRLRLAAQEGMPADFLRQLSKTDRAGGIFSSVIESGEAGLVSDIATDGELAPLFKGSEGVKCLVVFPLKSQSGIVGLMAAACAERHDLDAGERSLLEAFGADLGTAVDSISSGDSLRRTFLSTIRAFSQAIDTKDAHAHGHSDKVVAIAVAIAEQMNLDEDVIKGIREAGYLHDIGKIGAPESLFGKAGALTEEEMMTVREHPGLSHQILEGAHISPEIREMIRHHHERFDGSGYPDELRGSEIPLGARILCVADAFEAMTSERSYRSRLSKEEAVNELKRWSGTQFDPRVVEAFIKVKHKLAEGPG